MAQAHNFGILGADGKAIEGVSLTLFSDKGVDDMAEAFAAQNLPKGSEAPASEVEKAKKGMMMSRARAAMGRETNVFPLN